MSHQSDNSHYVRRVVLPSGRAIEVVYFDSSAAVEQHTTRGRDIQQLHVCPECKRDLVYPVEWEESSPTHWEVELRCPNCEWHGEGVYAQAVVEQLDEHLDNGTQVLVRDLKHLMHANMEDEVERFIAALRAGQIWPMDF